MHAGNTLLKDTADIYYISEKVKMLIKCANVKYTAICDNEMSNTLFPSSCILLPGSTSVILILKFLTRSVLRLHTKSWIASLCSILNKTMPT